MVPTEEEDESMYTSDLDKGSDAHKDDAMNVDEEGAGNAINLAGDADIDMNVEEPGKEDGSVEDDMEIKK